MSGHLRANLWLLLLTLVACSVLYPLVLWTVGQTLFARQAEGSLIVDASGKAIGSRLIAQPFGADEYFQPRPSAASYNASASGASNWGASNPLLRDRVARTLGPIVRYKPTAKKEKTVQDDVAEWIKSRPKIVAEWAEARPSSAQAWVNADDKHKDAVSAWMKNHPDTVAARQKANPGSEPKPADFAVDFFKDNANAFHKAWPKLIDDAAWSAEAVFFDMWLHEHADAPLEPVPADLVMASASGLDPHITLANARYQLDRVAEAWAKKLKADDAKVRIQIDRMLEEEAHAPLGGLVGVPLINVLEINLALRDR